MNSAYQNLVSCGLRILFLTKNSKKNEFEGKNELFLMDFEKNRAKNS